MRRSIFVFAVAASSVACGSILGIPSHEQVAPEDAGPSDAAVVSCGIAFSDPCRGCAEAKCCHEASTCATSPACSALEGCLGACRGDPACRSQCTIDNPIVSAAAIPAALDACLASNCEDACGLTCGALSKVAEPSAATECSNCIRQKYCSQAEACARSTECQRGFLCRENCVTGDCAGACSLPANDGGVSLCLGTCGAFRCITSCTSGPESPDSLYADFYGPVSGQCQSECNAGGNWSCVGHVQWPAAKALTRALTVGLVDILDGHPEGGVTVTMCGVGDPACVTKIDQQVTDTSGLARLVDDTAVVNGQANGLLGYLELSSPNLYPTIIYWGFPLSEPEGVLATPLPVFSTFEWPFVPESYPGVIADPARGHIAIVTVDCLGNQAAGVTFSANGIDAATQLLYVAGETLNAVGPTDGKGVAFFVNVPLGSIDIAATPVRLGRVSGHISVFVRPGTLTQVSLAPSLL